MNKKTGFILFFLALAFFGIYIFFPKRKNIDNEEIDEGKKNILQLIAPPNTEQGDSILYDTSNGAGLQAIEAQSANIADDKALMQDIRSKEKIGLDLFVGVTGNPANMYRKFILEKNGGTDDTDILLIPESVNDDFIRGLKSIKTFVKNFQLHENSDGRDEAIKKLISLSDFSDLTNYSIFPDFNTLDNEIICDSKGYGSCKFPKKKKSRNQHFEDFIKDVPIICDNFIEATEKIERALNKYAISMLRKNGWKFVGLDLPN